MTLNYNFVKFENFERLFQDKTMWLSLWHNLEFCVIGGILIFVIAMFNAVVITQSRLREKKFYRVAFFFPNILSIVITSLLWMFIYNPSFGILNGFLDLIGLGEFTKAWLGTKETVIPSLIATWVWMSTGFYMVLFMAAIEGIPDSIFEAAELDGSNSWQKFRHITFPLLKETSKTALVFFFINAFSGVFTLVNVMTDGGPSRASEVLTNYMYNEAFQQSDFGYATTLGVFVFFVLLLISSVMLVLTRTKDKIEY